VNKPAAPPPNDSPANDSPATDAPADGAVQTPERIAKRLARAGVASRRDIEKMIAEGRIAVDGKVIAEPGTKVTDAARITVDGKPVAAPEAPRMWRFHKPAGLVTTHKDEHGRQTVFEVLPPAMRRVISVGRLDLNSEGLLLLTNDGAIARLLELPSTAWVRRYRVRAFGHVEETVLAGLAKGITVDGVRYQGIEASLDRVQGSNLWLTMGLREGKNREIRRVLEALGLRVNRLIRLSYGPFHLGQLPKGAVEEIPRKILREQLGAKIPALAEKPPRRGQAR
jgi:23S rRNA pseudouridine2605 synthase